jgi:hypothetical protein
MMMTFVFLGTFTVALDDTTTKIYDGSAFKNGDPKRLVIQKPDNSFITDDEFEKILDISRVESIEKYSSIADINYYYREEIDYRNYTVFTQGKDYHPVLNPGDVHITNAVEFLSHDLYLSTVPVRDKDIIKSGKMAEGIYEAVSADPSYKVGDKVTIEVDIYPGQQFEGVVSRINPAFDARTRTFGVEITIPNKSMVLRPGMYARAIFNMGQRQSVMVADKAVQKQSGSSERYVYVIKDGVADYRFVTDGRRVGDMVEIIEGLEAGEEVATTSFTRLMNGKAVTVNNEPAVENIVVEE